MLIDWNSKDYFQVVNILAGLILIALCLILATKSGSILYRVQKIASEKSEFDLTYFIIYDRSTETVCDRLICVKPFDWWVYAKNGDVLIFNIQ